MDDIDKLINEIKILKSQMSNLKQDIEANECALRDNYEQKILTAFSKKEGGVGTVKFSTAQHNIKFVIGKKVTWDQDGLQRIKKLIKDAGQNVSDYISEELKVSERDFKSFPENIKEVFEPARIVSKNKIKIDIEEV